MIGTSLEQSNKLVELGIDKLTADMYWDTATEPLMTFPMPEGFESDPDFENMEKHGLVPAWSLNKLLEIIEIEYTIEKTMLDQSGVFFHSIVTDEFRTYERETLIEAAVDMLTWYHNTFKNHD